MNLKLRILPFLLMLIAVCVSACGTIGFFLYVTPLSVTGCTLTVIVNDQIAEDYRIKKIFSRSLSFGEDIRNLYDIGFSDEFYVGLESRLALDGRFNVRRFTFKRGKWFFEILADGNRSIFYVQTLFGGVEESHEKAITDNGWLWVDGDYVDEFNGRELRCDETDEIINVMNPTGETITPFYFCLVSLTETSVPGRVGPGEDRAIRAYIPQSEQGYGVSGSTTTEDGNLWYELNVPDVGFLWVPASQTNEFDHLRIYDPLTGKTFGHECMEYGIPEKNPPPPIYISDQAGNSVECGDFAITRPSQIVPAEPSYYEWTPYDGADDYIISLTDYQGNWVTSIPVEGSQNRVLIDTGSLPTGSQLSVEVTARIGGESVCNTNSGLLTRTAEYVAEESEPVVEKKEKKKKDDGYKPPK